RLAVRLAVRLAPAWLMPSPSWAERVARSSFAAVRRPPPARLTPRPAYKSDAIDGVYVPAWRIVAPGAFSSGSGLPCPGEQMGLQRLAGACPPACRCGVDMGDDTVVEHRGRIADARRGRRHRQAGDAAAIKRRQAADAGVVPAEPGVAEHRREAVDPQGHARVAADQGAVRGGDDDLLRVVGSD